MNINPDTDTHTNCPIGGEPGNFFGVVPCGDYDIHEHLAMGCDEHDQQWFGTRTPVTA